MERDGESASAEKKNQPQVPRNQNTKTSPGKSAMKRLDKNPSHTNLTRSDESANMGSNSTHQAQTNWDGLAHIHSGATYQNQSSDQTNNSELLSTGSKLPLMDNGSAHLDQPNSDELPSIHNGSAHLDQPNSDELPSIHNGSAHRDQPNSDELPSIHNVSTHLDQPNSDELPSIHNGSTHLDQPNSDELPSIHNGSTHLDQPNSDELPSIHNVSTQQDQTNSGEFPNMDKGSNYMDQPGSVIGQEAVNLGSMTTPPRLGLDQPDFIYSPEVQIISLIDLEYCNMDCHSQHLQPELAGSAFPQTSTPFGVDFSDVSSVTSSGPYQQCESYLDPSSGFTSQQGSSQGMMPFTIFKDEKSTSSPSSEVDKNVVTEVFEANYVGEEGGYDEDSDNAGRIGNGGAGRVDNGGAGRVDNGGAGRVDNGGAGRVDNGGAGRVDNCGAGRVDNGGAGRVDNGGAGRVDNGGAGRVDNGGAGRVDNGGAGRVDNGGAGRVDNCGAGRVDNGGAGRVDNGGAGREAVNRTFTEVDGHYGEHALEMYADHVDNEHALEDEDKDVVMPLVSRAGNRGMGDVKNKCEIKAEVDEVLDKENKAVLLSIESETGNGFTEDGRIKCGTGNGFTEDGRIKCGTGNGFTEDGRIKCGTGNGFTEDGRIKCGTGNGFTEDGRIKCGTGNGFTEDGGIKCGMEAKLDDELQQNEDVILSSTYTASNVVGIGGIGYAKGTATMLSEERGLDEEDGDRVMPLVGRASLQGPLGASLQGPLGASLQGPLGASLQGPLGTPDAKPKILITDMDEGTIRYSGSGRVDTGGRPDTPIMHHSMNASRLRYLSGTSCGGSPAGTQPASYAATRPATLAGTQQATYAGPQHGTSTVDTFRLLMERKAKLVPARLELFKPKIDLLKLVAPPCKLSPALTEVLTPTAQSNLLPLNLLPATLESGPPLFIVHSFDGSLRPLEALGVELGMMKIACCGIQRTVGTPSDSVENIASYYLAAVQHVQESGPYRLAGYGFGCMVAIEMALQLQAQGTQVASLIMLDSSPLHIHLMLAYSIRCLPPGATTAEVDDALVSGALLRWMESCGPVKRRGLVYGLLNKMSCHAEKILTAVDLTFGDAVLSPSVHRTRWLMARHKLKRRGLSMRAGQFVGAAQEIVRLKRKEKAVDYVNHILLARRYQFSAKFKGSIHLLRVKADMSYGPYECVPVDYGLGSVCTDDIHVINYEADHGSFLETAPLTHVAKDTSHILKGTLVDYMQDNGMQHRIEESKY